MTGNIKYLVIYLCVFMAFWQGCEELVDFPEDEVSNPVPVIEAILTDQLENHKVRVSYSVAVNDSNSSRPVEDALVKVVSASGDTFHYNYSTDGWYISSVFHAVPGISYSLEVTIDGIVYKSEGEVIEMNGIDSIYCRHLPVSTGENSVYYVFIDAGPSYKDDPRYYIINAAKNGELLSIGSNIWIFNDRYVETINGIKLPQKCVENDTVWIDLCSVSETVYTYYSTLAYEVFVINLSNLSYRGNPPQFFQPAALGYFQVSAVSHAEILIKATE